ncbi:hydantoinase/oxoprolinase family protein [Microbacterium sp. RD1]|uniref:hydantoinase/oxoprolinase family protein n=1 Tax=Microbacterium sp. RD1 TaxID=3457313 RepID=UPI003FA61267
MIGVDVGGTFTDVVAIHDGVIKTTKVPTDARHTDRGVVRGAKELGVENSSVFNHASTHGLNAIITRRLPKIGFLTTGGHRDILDMGRVWRPAEGLMDPSWRRTFGDVSRPLVPRYLRRGIKERKLADGSTLIPLDEEQARAELRVLAKCDVEGVAICLINSYVDRAHEVRLREIVREELGDVPVSISSEVSPLAKEFARASTTTVDVFMQLIYGSYTERLDSGLREIGFDGDLNFADCSAQLVRADVAMEHPYRIVFAGPAAGTMSCAHFGNMIDAPNLICADVGGTSCDISLVTDGKPSVNTTFELEHDLIVNALSNEVTSIGAGGGSIISVNTRGELEVGPASAGSYPGPAAYGNGGTEPTMTDAYLLIGILDAGTFAGGAMSLNTADALAAFENLDSSLSLEERIQYAFNIGVANVAEGVFGIAVQNGIDPRDYSLVAYGAAGPMMLPAVLEQTHAKNVVIPPHPGLFSALGLVSSDLVYSDSQSAYTMLAPEAAPTVAAVYAEMEAKLRDQIGDRHGDVEFKRSFDGRLAGQSWETPFIDVPSGEIDAAAIEQMVANFHSAYEKRAGNRFEMLPVQGVTYRLQAVVPSEKVSYPVLPPREDGSTLTAVRHVTIKYLYGEDTTAAEYHRDDLRDGDVIVGPAIIREALSTTFMVPGQTATVGSFGEITITRS